MVSPTRGHTASTWQQWGCRPSRSNSEGPGPFIRAQPGLRAQALELGSLLFSIPRSLILSAHPQLCGSRDGETKRVVLPSLPIHPVVGGPDSAELERTPNQKLEFWVKSLRHPLDLGQVTRLRGYERSVGISGEPGGRSSNVKVQRGLRNQPGVYDLGQCEHYYHPAVVLLPCGLYQHWAPCRPLSRPSQWVPGPARWTTFLTGFPSSSPLRLLPPTPFPKGEKPERVTQLSL